MILLPQAFRIMLPALISQLVVVLKDTSLGFIISYEELLGRADHPRSLRQPDPGLRRDRASSSPAINYSLSSWPSTSSGGSPGGRRTADRPRPPAWHPSAVHPSAEAPDRSRPVGTVTLERGPGRGCTRPTPVATFRRAQVKEAPGPSDGVGTSLRRRDEWDVTATLAPTGVRGGTSPTPDAGRPTLLRSFARPRWWAEIATIAVLYAVYSLVRNSVGDVVARAYGNSREILAVEDDWGLALERGLNGWVHRTDVVAGAVALHYATLHFLVTPAVLAWLFLRRPTRYRAASDLLVVTTALALSASTGCRPRRRDCWPTRASSTS